MMDCVSAAINIDFPGVPQVGAPARFSLVAATLNRTVCRRKTSRMEIYYNMAKLCLRANWRLQRHANYHGATSCETRVPPCKMRWICDPLCPCRWPTKTRRFTKTKRVFAGPSEPCLMSNCDSTLAGKRDAKQMKIRGSARMRDTLLLHMQNYAHMEWRAVLLC